MQLPTRTKSIEALKSLEAPVKWNELFVNRSSFKLLFFANFKLAFENGG